MDSPDEDDLVDVDPYDDCSFPAYGYLQVPDAAAIRKAARGEGPIPETGLATRRQLRAMCLSPGGQEPAARMVWRGGRRWAWLYSIELAVPERTATLAQEAALDKAMAARQTCPLCRRRYFKCLVDEGRGPGTLFLGGMRRGDEGRIRTCVHPGSEPGAPPQSFLVATVIIAWAAVWVN